MTDMAVPDAQNFNGIDEDKPIPDNFLDDTINKAMANHRRKESQIQSVEADFAKHLEANVAQNIAANLIAYMHTDETPRDPDEDDVRQEEDDEPTNDDNDDNRLDEILIETVHKHKRKESRQDFVQQKLHEMFPEHEEEQNDLVEMGLTAGGTGFGGGKIDMSQIASNLVAFLHDDGSKPQTPQFPPEEIILQQSLQQNDNKKRARGSTDLTALQDAQDERNRLREKVNNLENKIKAKDEENKELNDTIKKLEDEKMALLKDIQFLQQSKTTLAINSTKCIDELRGLLLQYQKQLKLTSD